MVGATNEIGILKEVNHITLIVFLKGNVCVGGGGGVGGVGGGC